MFLGDVLYSFICAVVLYSLLGLYCSAFVWNKGRTSWCFLTGIKARASYSFGDQFVHFNVKIPTWVLFPLSVYFTMHNFYMYLLPVHYYQKWMNDMSRCFLQERYCKYSHLFGRIVPYVIDNALQKICLLQDFDPKTAWIDWGVCQRRTRWMWQTCCWSIWLRPW